MFWKRQRKSPPRGGLILVVGATKTGKTTYVRRHFLHPPALVVAIVEYPWRDIREITTIDQLLSWKKGVRRLTSLLLSKDFDPVVLLAKKNYNLIIDDAPTLMSQVAPLSWKKPLLTSRNHGITAVYITQSFSDIPALIIRNMDYLILGHLPARGAEEKILSRIFGRPITLPEVEPYQFIKWKVPK